MQPQMMAHRGNSGLAPENTLAAFAAALDTRSQWVELDVHLTADGEVVVMHDSTVDRTTNGKGAIRDLTLAQIRSLDAGGWFSPEFAGERVPTLAEVVDLLGDRLRINVEIKSSADPESAAKVVGVLRDGGVLRQSIISSFGLEAVLEVRNHWADPVLALITGSSGDLQTAIDHGLQYFNIEHRAVDADLLERTHAAGILANVWTIDDPEVWRHFASLGADVITTNQPHLMPT